MSGGETATTLEVWRAEVFARAGRPDSAMVVYERLITPDAAGAALALDAGETMLDNGYLDQAKGLLSRGGRHGSPQPPALDRAPRQAVARATLLSGVSVCVAPEALVTVESGGAIPFC